MALYTPPTKREMDLFTEKVILDSKLKQAEINLRDEYAKSILSGLLSNPVVVSGGISIEYQRPKLIKEALDMADAVIDQRGDQEYNVYKQRKAQMRDLLYNAQRNYQEIDPDNPIWGMIEDVLKHE